MPVAVDSQTQTLICVRGVDGGRPMVTETRAHVHLSALGDESAAEC